MSTAMGWAAHGYIQLLQCVRNFSGFTLIYRSNSRISGIDRIFEITYYLAHGMSTNVSVNEFNVLRESAELTGESMKKARVLAICLTVLLVSATSSFAAVIWTATGTPSVYQNNYINPSSKWASGVLDLSKVQGAAGPLTLTLSFTTDDVLGKTKLYVDGTRVDGRAASWVYGKTDMVFTQPVDVAFNSKGVYSLSAYFTMSGSPAATWTLTGATLSNSQPTTPIPAAGLLLGSGLLGLFGIGKARRKKD